MKNIKKIAIALLSTGIFLVASGSAYASVPQEYNFSVTPDLGPDYIQPVDAPGNTGNCQLFGVDSTTNTPRLIILGTGLNCGSGSTLNFSGLLETSINSLVPDLDTIRSGMATTSMYLAGATSTLNFITPQVVSNTAFISGINANISGASTTMMVTSSLGGFMYATDKIKLDSISTSTVQADYTQASTTVASYIKNKPSLATVATTGLYSDLTGKPSLGVSYEGTTQRINSFPIFKSVTVASGVAVFNLTSDGTSGGTALFPNGVIQDSVNVFVSDATASYQMSYAFTNSNKTLTVTTNKLTTANILTGVLGQSAANGSVVKLQVWGY